MKQTKDNWIKALEKMFEGDLNCIDCNAQLFNEQETEHARGCMFLKMKSFISQVEKDAIEKTNKRWREELLAWYPVSRKKSVPWHDEQNKYRRRLVKNIKRVSDLLEDK